MQDHCSFICPAILNTFAISGIYETAKPAAAAPMTLVRYFFGTNIPAVIPIENRHSFVSAKSLQVLWAA